MKLREIASALEAKIENADPDLEITGVAGIEEAAAGHITFVVESEVRGRCQDHRCLGCDRL